MHMLMPTPDASGNLCRTISTCFRDAGNSRPYILCVDVRPWRTPHASGTIAA
jgi:hypothetical protein